MYVLISPESLLANLPSALWKTYPPHDNYGFLPNVHKQAVTDLAFSPSNASVLYSVGADGMLIATDLDTSDRLVRYSAHYGPVNSLAVTRAGSSAGRELLLTGGDDGIARVWDPAREGKDPVVELDDELGGVVTAVEWSADGSAAFVGGVDNEIKVSRATAVRGLGSCSSARCGISGNKRSYTPSRATQIP